MVFAVVMAYVPIVRAATPAMTQVANQAAVGTINANTWTTTSLTNPHTTFTAFTTIVAFISCAYTTSPAPLVNSVTDSLSDTGWTKAAAAAFPSFYAGASSNPATVYSTEEIWYLQNFALPVPTTFTMTFAFAGTAIGCGLNLQRIDNGVFAMFNHGEQSVYFAGAGPAAQQILTGSIAVPAGGFATVWTGAFMLYSTGTGYPGTSGVTDSLGNALTKAGSGTLGETVALTPAPNAALAYTEQFSYSTYYAAGGNIFWTSAISAGAATVFNPTYASMVIVWSNTGATVTTGTSRQTQTLGSCPTAASFTGTLAPAKSFTMVNNTIYMYSGNALAFEVVDTISVGLNSTIGSGSHTLRLLFYASAGSTVSIAQPLTKFYEHSFTISSGTTDQIITAQVNLQLQGAFSVGNTIAVGVVGDNKIKIANSTTAGIHIFAGNPSTSTQPSTFTSMGTADKGTSGLALCASLSYQSTATLTSTTSFTTTTGGTATTVTTTKYSITNSNELITGGGFALMLEWFVILVMPSMIIGVITKSLWGGILGAVLGLTVAVIALSAPFWVIIVVVVAIVGAMFFGSRQSGGV